MLRTCQEPVKNRSRAAHEPLSSQQRHKLGLEPAKNHLRTDRWWISGSQP